VSARKAIPRVLVVGAGIMGLCTAWALARAGAKVTVVEQAAVPNQSGSSVDQHRLIRYPYGAARGYLRMVGEAYAAWDRLWHDLGETLYARTGTLALASGPGWVADSMATLAAEAVPFARIDAAAVARDHPILTVTPEEHAIRLDSGGTLLAAAIVARLARHLASRVTIVANARVTSLDTTRARVTLADGQAIAGDMLVVAAGPWTNRLLPGMAARMTPSRQVVVYLTPPSDLAPHWQRAPMVIDTDRGAGFYVVPPRGATALKIGNHDKVARGDPDGDRSARPDEVAPILDAARARLARFDDYRIAFAKVCFYDVAADARFIVEPVGRRAWAMTGFSGHGFKFGAAIGLRVAETIMGRQAPEELTRWAAGEI
jgi:glycine/D-amino acid oxidase-like deaminating enzyme